MSDYSDYEEEFEADSEEVGKSIECDLRATYQSAFVSTPPIEAKDDSTDANIDPKEEEEYYPTPREEQTMAKQEEEDHATSREEQAMAMYRSAFKKTSSLESKRKKRSSKEPQTRDERAMKMYRKARATSNIYGLKNRGGGQHTRTIATQTNDSWLPELIQKIVQQRVKEERENRQRVRNEDALEFMDEIPRSQHQHRDNQKNFRDSKPHLPSIQNCQSLDNFLASSPFPFHRKPTNVISSARQHRLKRLNNNVYSRKKNKNKQKNKKKTEYEKCRLLLSNVRRVINMNRKGTIEILRQNDLSNGNGILGIDNIKSAFKKLNLILTSNDIGYIILSLRIRSKDSKASLNYFTLLRAVREKDYPSANRIELALGIRKPRVRQQKHQHHHHLQNNNINSNDTILLEAPVLPKKIDVKNDTKRNENIRISQNQLEDVAKNVALEVVNKDEVAGRDEESFDDGLLLLMEQEKRLNRIDHALQRKGGEREEEEEEATAISNNKSINRSNRSGLLSYNDENGDALLERKCNPVAPVVTTSLPSPEGKTPIFKSDDDFDDNDDYDDNDDDALPSFSRNQELERKDLQDQRETKERERKQAEEIAENNRRELRRREKKRREAELKENKEQREKERIEEDKERLKNEQRELREQRQKEEQRQKDRIKEDKKRLKNERKEHREREKLERQMKEIERKKKEHREKEELERRMKENERKEKEHRKKNTEKREFEQQLKKEKIENGQRGKDEKEKQQKAKELDEKVTQSDLQNIEEQQGGGDDDNWFQEMADMMSPNEELSAAATDDESNEIEKNTYVPTFKMANKESAQTYIVEGKPRERRSADVFSKPTMTKRKKKKKYY
jgi:hypothetical protein